MHFPWLFEPPHDKTNKMACAHSEDSYQPGHPPSLIRVVTDAQADLSLSLGAQVILLVLSKGIYLKIINGNIYAILLLYRGFSEVKPLKLFALGLFMLSLNYNKRL